MDLLGVSRTIDHAVYTAFNALAIALWRLDAALLGMSVFGYRTQDWLTGQDGQGVWFLLAKMVGAHGIVGVATWQAFLALALVLYGLSLVVRPFLRVAPVDIGRLFLYAIVAYIFITQGSRLMQDAERWRAVAGSYIYQAMSDSDVSALTPPTGSSSDDDPLYPPADLDGVDPIRGWEAVGSSYFLARTDDEIHDVVPPHDYRVAYCLYDPRLPIDSQAEENNAHCSPRKAWDEWDLVSTGTITNVFGLPLPINVGISLPISQDHPENRQLGIRQAQAGAARLALGPVVALFPLLEANVGLMLALAASFIYLSLPIMLLFGFFRATETLVVGLMFQYLNIIIRTLILQGLVALFLIILIGVAAQGSLAGYLGLIGVGLMGGFFLSRMATATLRETMTQTLGAVGRLWTGAATGAFGEAARKPAQKVFGAATLAGAGLTAGAVAAAGGLGQAFDLAEPTLDVARGGLRDVKGERSAAQVGQPMPDSLAVLAQQGSGVARQFGSGKRDAPTVPRHAAGYRSAEFQSYDNQAHAALTTETWADNWYGANRSGRDKARVRADGNRLLGEDLRRRAEPVLRRHRQEDTAVVLNATRELARENPRRFIQPDGSLSAEGVRAVRERLDEKTRRAFSGQQGRHDLETLVAVGAQSDRRAEPTVFRRETARAKNGFGDQAPGRTIPQALGLDAVAGGAHFAEMNRFVRLGDRAGLSAEQRERLLTETRNGEVSPQLRAELAAAVQRSGSNIEPDTLINAARAMPETVSGPRQVRFGHQAMQTDITDDRKDALRRVDAAPPTPTGKAEISPDILSVSADAKEKPASTAASLRDGHPSSGRQKTDIRKEILADAAPDGDKPPAAPRGRAAVTPPKTPLPEKRTPPDTKKPASTAASLRDGYPSSGHPKTDIRKDVLADAAPDGDKPPAAPRGRAVFSVDAAPSQTPPGHSKSQPDDKDKSALAAALTDGENETKNPTKGKEEQHTDED